VISEKIVAQIATMSLEPVITRLVREAREEVGDTFCREQCGHGPEGDLCIQAYRRYEEILNYLLREYVRLN
jgi:hypothetical protein